MLSKQTKRKRRHRRVRAKVKGSAKVPRLSVFRSNKHIYVQLVDDEKGKTLLSASDLELKRSRIESPAKAAAGKEKSEAQIKDQKPRKPLTNKVSSAYEIGRLIAEKALEKNIKKAVFDRGGYRYHGRVRSVAEGARESGLKF